MIRILVLAIACVLAVPLGAEGLPPTVAVREADIGTGWIRGKTTPCTIAHLNRGQPCEVPEIEIGHGAPVQAASHVVRAWHYVDLQEMRTALAEADAALELAPDDVAIRHLVARIALSGIDIDRADRELKILLARAPKDADIRATAAELLHMREANIDAADRFSGILADHPRHVFSRYRRGYILLSQGMANAARKDFDILLAGAPRHAVYLNLRARSLMMLGKPEAAIADLTAALQSEPESFVLLTERAEAFLRIEDYARALEDYEKVLGPVGGASLYGPQGGDTLNKHMVNRAFILTRIRRFDDAASEVIRAAAAGGRRTFLRAQTYLRQNGFPTVPLDGKDSKALRDALRVCFGLNTCFQTLTRSI